MDAIRTRIDGGITKVVTFLSQPGRRLYYYGVGLVNIVSSIALPAKIYSLHKDKKPPTHTDPSPHSPYTPYAWFLANAGLSLLTLAWTGAFLSRPTEFRANMNNPIIRRGVKVYHFLESVSLTIAIGALSVEEGRTPGSIIVLNAISYSVCIFVYIVVLAFARKLNSGYEGTVLAVIMSSAFTFASQLAVKSPLPFIVFVSATAIGAFLTVLTDYVLPEEPLVKDAGLTQALHQAAKVALSQAAPEKRTILLQQARGAAARDLPQLAIIRAVNDARTALSNTAEANLVAAARAAILLEAPAAQEALIEAVIAAADPAVREALVAATQPVQHRQIRQYERRSLHQRPSR